MRDTVILAVTAAFFTLCVAYVRWCDHIIGPDPDVTDDEAAGLAADGFANEAVGALDAAVVPS